MATFLDQIPEIKMQHVNLILEYFQAVDINKEIEGRTPIHYAADYGQCDVIKYLVSKGANVNVSKPFFSIKNINSIKYNALGFFFFFRQRINMELVLC